MGQLGDNEVDGADDYIGILDEEQPGVTSSAVVQEMTGDDDDGDVASVVCRLFQVAFLLQNSAETPPRGREYMPERNSRLARCPKKDNLVECRYKALFMFSYSYLHSCRRPVFRCTLPQIGQSMNTALADAAVLHEFLDEYKDDLDVVLPAFSRERV